MLTIHELRKMEERAAECDDCNDCDHGPDRKCGSFFGRKKYSPLSAN